MTKARGQPIIADLKRSALDHLLEVVAIATVFAIVVMTAYYYPLLPDVIPRHFNAAGEPDGFGNKVPFLFILPSLVLLSYLGLAALARSPHQLNYMVQISNYNAESQYRNARHMVLAVRACALGMFTWIHWARIQTALGQAEGPGRYFLPISVTLMLVVVAVALVRSRRLG